MKLLLGVAAVPVLAVVLVLSAVLLDDDTPAAASGGTGVLNTDAVPAAYRAAITQAATRCPAITGPVLAAQIDTESSWNPTAVSPAGAEGIAQFMPATWTSWGRDYDGDAKADPLDPADAIGSQADYMCSLSDWVTQQLTAGTITGDELQLTLAAYNAGTSRIQAAGGIPDIDETRTYVARILATIPTYTADGAADVVAWATTQVGKPYLWAANGPDAYDCSGLTQQAWARAGIVLPHDSRKQYIDTPTKVALSDLQPGDLVFWATNLADPTTIYHVAIWAGDGSIIEAPATNVAVRVAPMRWDGVMPDGVRP